MIKDTIDKGEVDAILKIINKIERKSVFSYIGMIMGALVSILALVYLVKNPTIITGSLSLLAIGVFVIIINKITLKDYKKRIEQLKNDLKKTQEILLNQEDY